jgi:hypothetical protein
MTNEENKPKETALVAIEVDILELDERLDLTIDPFMSAYAAIAGDTDGVCPNVWKCSDTYCSGGNCVAGCGS